MFKQENVREGTSGVKRCRRGNVRLAAGLERAQQTMEAPTPSSFRDICPALLRHYRCKSIYPRPRFSRHSSAPFRYYDSLITHSVLPDVVRGVFYSTCSKCSEMLALYQEDITSVVNKDLAFKAKAKAKDLTSRTSSRTAFDRGVFEC